MNTERKAKLSRSGRLARTGMAIIIIPFTAYVVYTLVSQTTVVNGAAFLTFVCAVIGCLIVDHSRKLEREMRLDAS